MARRVTETRHRGLIAERENGLYNDHPQSRNLDDVSDQPETPPLDFHTDVTYYNQTDKPTSHRRRE